MTMTADEIRALLGPRQWQDISTAPRDETLILALDRNAANVAWMWPYVMRFRGLNWEYLDGSGWRPWPGEPKVWLPIPEVPTP